MKKTILVFTALLMTASLNSWSNEGENEDPVISPAEIAKSHAAYCGTIDEVLAAMDQPAGQLPTAEELTELQTIREPIFNVIKEGAPALDMILKEGEKNDTGGFGVLLTCGLIDQISELVKSKGCLNLKTQEILNEGPGLALCRDIIKDLNKK